MKKKYDYIVGIDPDTDKSGFATIAPATREASAVAIDFPTLLDRLFCIKQNADACGQTVLVVVEAGWLNRSNWHLRNNDNTRQASAKGNAAGRNHETGRKIIEMARHYGLETVEARPLRKCWSGTDGKITAAELSAFAPIDTRTNQEARDALLLAWVYAGLPIRVPAASRNHHAEAPRFSNKQTAGNVANQHR